MSLNIVIVVATFGAIVCSLRQVDADAPIIALISRILQRKGRIKSGIDLNGMLWNNDVTSAPAVG